MAEILVIDDDIESFLTGLKQALRDHRIHLAYSGKQGLKVLDENPRIATVLLDILMPPEFAEVDAREGIEVLKKIKQLHPGLPVIMLTVLHDIDLVVEAIQAGAFHYIPKPIDRDKLRDTVRRAVENRELKERVNALSRSRDALLKVYRGKGKGRAEFHGMIGTHPLMQELYDRIEQAAPFDDMKVVLLGESGSGKDLAARALHKCGPRATRPFLPVNCAALAENVLESELFGHVKGAFTGADADHDGLFVRANRGTLFLDEIAEMSRGLQSKLLRAIETMEITPMGGKKPIQVDVRVICATNRDLAAVRDEGKFRPDLFHRIMEIFITIPALRQRSEDIPLLVKHCLGEFVARHSLSCTIDDAAVAALLEYDWPGNVRELAATVRRLAIFAKDGHITGALVRKALGLGPPAEPAPSVEPVEAEIVVPQEAGAPETTEFPEITDLSEYRRIHGEAKLKEVLERAIREGGNAKNAMVLLGMPEDKYDAFRKCLQRLGVRVRELKE